MKTLRYAALALAVSGVFTLGAKAADTTNAWWNITFDDALGAYMPDRPEEAMVVLTNRFSESPRVDQPWSAGYWTTGESDETTVTNSYFPTNTFKAFGQDTCIKLDTQGDDLTWWTEPTNPVAEIRSMRTLVDADLYLVGSDSAPDAGDFDKGENVQTAIYLMNETDEDGLTTNSVLCVYVRNASGSNYWQELKGVKLYDNDWAHVQVIVDHSLATPMVRVYVNNVQMTARDGDAHEWSVANLDNAQAAKKVSSISFRGTGAVDNFVGQVVEVNPDKYDFTAEVYMDGTNVLATGSAGNVKRTENAAAGEGRFVKFEDFLLSNYDYEYESHDADWALSKIVVINPANGSETTYHYEWVGYPDYSVVPVDGQAENPAFKPQMGTGQEGVQYQEGPFDLELSTAGATANVTIVKVYFKTIGLCDAKAVTVNVGGDTTTDVTSLKPTDYPTNLVWKFPASKPGYVLSTIQTAADVTYEGGYATVSTNLQTLTADTTFVTATYVEGTLAEGQELRYSFSDGTYTFEAYTPPVAIIVAGNVTNEYPSLRAAILDAHGGDTIYLVADDHVSFTAEDPEVVINKTLTIDGGSNTLYGVSNYAPPSNGSADHDIYIGGSAAVTIKNLTLSEFSDTAPAVQQRTNPIWVGQGYTGKLLLDGVTVTNFNRTAINLGGGTFEITNCVIAGCYDPEMAGERFQSAIEIFDAIGTVAETTVTGIGSTIEREGSDIASCFTLQSNWATTPWTGGTGELTVLSGSYTGEYIGLGMTNAAGKLFIEGGTFVATAPKTVEVEGVQTSVSAFGLNGEDHASKIVIFGGWYDREPEAEFLAKGYGAVEAAPGTDTPYTVVLANAIWIGGASGNWSDAANWDVGIVPTKTTGQMTVVTFTNDAQVAISATDACKEMVLSNANVTLVRAPEVGQPILRFYSNEGRAVSVASGATGSLGVSGLSLFNERKNDTDLTIGCDLEVQDDITFRGISIVDKSKSASFTITGKTTVSGDALVKTIDYGTTKFQGGIEVAKGVTAKIATAPNGGATIGTAVTLVANDGTGAPTAIWLMQVANKASLASGVSVDVDAAHADTYYVKTRSDTITGDHGGTCTVYEALPKRTVVSVAATDVTVEGVSEGLHFVPGTNLTINVSGIGEGYEPSVTITNSVGVLLTTNVATFVYQAPDSDIAVIATKVLKTFDITFKPENGSSDIVTNVAYGATAYAPADPTLDGFEFLGWTNSLDSADATLYSNTNLPPAAANATYAAKWDEVPAGHIGAKSDEGFVILASTDPDYDATKPLTFAAPNVTAGTVAISASMVGPDSGTTATLTLLYKTDLSAATYSTVAVTVKDIDATAGTATVELPANFMDGKNTMFFFGFSNEEGVLDE